MLAGCKSSAGSLRVRLACNSRRILRVLPYHLGNRLEVCVLLVLWSSDEVFSAIEMITLAIVSSPCLNGTFSLDTLTGRLPSSPDLTYAFSLDTLIRQVCPAAGSG